MATSPAITVLAPATAPSLTVSASSVSVGQSVTVTLHDGYGGSTDWVALSAIGAPATQVLWYAYVGTGATSGSWTVPMPLTAGQYEFRLFPNNGYTSVATSPPVSVLAPATAPSFTVSAMSVAPGDSVTVALHDGYGGSADWVGLAATGAPPTEVLWYAYVGSGVTTNSWTVAMPSAEGQYEFRYFPNNGYTIVARSGAVAVGTRDATLHMMVNSVAPPGVACVAPGTPVSLDVANGPGNVGDWIGLYNIGPASVPMHTDYLDWRYLSGTYDYPPAGVEAATMTFSAPDAPGRYEFRFCPDDSYQCDRASVSFMVAQTSGTCVGFLHPSTSYLTFSSPVSLQAEVGRIDGAGVAAVSFFEGANLLATVTEPPYAFAWSPTPGTSTITAVVDEGGSTTASAPLDVNRTSATVDVNGTRPEGAVCAPPVQALTVQAHGTFLPSDIIGLYAIDAANLVTLTPGSWTYLNNTQTQPDTGLTNPVVSLTAPSDPGVYQLRLCTDNGLNCTARSAPITVPDGSACVTVTSPSPGTMFASPSVIDLAADAQAIAGSITAVDFYVDQALVGTVSAPPFTWPWSAPAAGTHDVLAVAHASGGGTTTSVPVAVTVQSGGASLGRLAVPVLKPRPGAYPPYQTIQIDGPPEAAIHYTLDGSEPSEASPVYVGPFPTRRSLTVRARAYAAGWDPSNEVAGQYGIDVTSPILTPEYSVEPNAADWVRAPLTVTLSCWDDLAGVASCPAPVVFSSEGAKQTVTVWATDAFKNARPLEVMANVDTSAPSLTLTSPASGAEVTSPTALVRGSAQDNVSGLQSVRCNDTPATISGSEYYCAVTLVEGMNSITVVAMDVAGNEGSVGVQVTRRSKAPVIAAVVPDWDASEALLSTPVSRLKKRQFTQSR